MRSVLVTIGGWVLLTGSLGAQEPRSNPFDTPEGAAQGGALFQTHCTYCHGARGEGGRGADLTTGQYRRGGSDANLYNTIRNGIPGTEMPSVRVTDDEVWKMVAFVRKLSAAIVSEKASGDPAAGRAVFEGKGACVSCHAVGREGGSLGPDLSDIGRRRNLQYLEESLLKPDAEVAIAYRTLEIVTASGQSMSGIKLNEDDVSIQLRDRNANLRSLRKADIREIRRNQPSLMPAYGSKLARKEIEDVVAYLNSLRGVQ
jgi:putative heme-binding domain-containing protein